MVVVAAMAALSLAGVPAVTRNANEVPSPVGLEHIAFDAVGLALDVEANLVVETVLEFPPAAKRTEPPPRVTPEAARLPRSHHRLHCIDPL